MTATAPAPTVELAISGMTCDGCSSTVESALVALPAVRSASVDHASGRAVVLLEDGADPETFAFDADAAVHDAGYEVETADLLAAPAGCCGGAGKARRDDAAAESGAKDGCCGGGGGGGCCS